MDVPTRSEVSVLSTPRPRDNGLPASAPKRPRVQSVNHTPSDPAFAKREPHGSYSNDASFSFFAHAASNASRQNCVTALLDQRKDAVTPVSEQDKENILHAPSLPAIDQLMPGFEFVSGQSQAQQVPLLNIGDTSNADVEVISLDGDDEIAPSTGGENQQAQFSCVGPAPIPVQGDDVIDLDDDEALANLQPLPRPYTRMHISRGGGLFRVQRSGQLEIVDSDDEEEMTQMHRIIGTEDGLHALSSTEPQQKSVTTVARQPVLLPISEPDPMEQKVTVPSQEIDTIAVEAPIPSNAGTAFASGLSAPLNGASAQYTHGFAPGSSTQPSLPSPDSNIQPSTPAFMKWPHPNLHTPTQGALVSSPSQPLDTFTFTDSFLHDSVPSFGREPLRHNLPAATVSSSQLSPIQNVTPIPGVVSPLSGTAWLSSRSPHALLQAEQRVALARKQTDSSNGTSYAADVNLSTTEVPISQVAYNSAALASLPTLNNQSAGGSLATVEDNGISAEGLRTLVKQNGLTADATEEAKTPFELNVLLMPHQQRALQWMSKRELLVTSDEEVSAVGEQGLGGILADDQGLGKTLTMIALCLKNRPLKRQSALQQEEKPAQSEKSVDLEEASNVENEEESELTVDDDDFVPPDRSEDLPWRTLIVCPLSVINQWKEELLSRIKEEFVPRVCIYHGPKRERRQTVLENCDVVITTYSTLVAEYPKVLKNHPEFKARKKAKLPLPTRPKGPICRVAWHRVVLDEAQHVKNRGTDSWSAVMSLKSEKRWCLTGTPIQNSVDDIYSLFCFIRYQFVPNYETWNTRWKKKLEHPQAGIRERAFKRFQTIVGVVLLRRTKNDTIKGAPLITLPKRTAETEEPEFCDKEEEVVYKAVQEKSVLTFNKFLVAGTLANNYSSVLLVLLRLRQACSHPFLIEYAGMHTRGHSVSENAPEIRSDQYSTAYSAEELEEALELVGGGHSLLSMIDDAARQRVYNALMPPAKGTSATTKLTCQYCHRDTPWSKGSFLSCGDVFCVDCCLLLREERKCLRCLCTIEDPNLTEVFINADDVRKEVHAEVILGEERDNRLKISVSEFKQWSQLEVIKRRSGLRSETVTPDTTDGEVDDADDDDDGALDRLEKTILEKKTKLSSYGNAAASCPRREEKKTRLLTALSQHSTKIRRILDKLNEIRTRDPSEKTLIFSQWTSMLDIIEFHVQLDGHEICRLDGSMTLSARQKQIESFRASPTKNVFLISLHAGGTGLNLTAARNVIITDVWWNPAVEEQAIDRVHRIGQTKDVQITRFRMKGTVEERIYAICAKKREAADGTLGVTGAQSLGRKKLSLQELMYIFGGAAQDVAQTAQRGSAAAEAASNILSFQQHGSI